MVGRSLAPGDKIALLVLAGDPQDPVFTNYRDTCRIALKDLSLVLECKDVYQKKMPITKRELSWFGRRLSMPFR